jgi:hypothetical protein
LEFLLLSIGDDAENITTCIHVTWSIRFFPWNVTNSVILCCLCQEILSKYLFSQNVRNHEIVDFWRSGNLSRKISWNRRLLKVW